MTLRLTLLAHGETNATRRIAFAAPDEPLDPRGHAGLARLKPPQCRALTSPAAAARQTAAALGVAAEVDEGLRDLWMGGWIGRTFEEVAADDPAGAAAFVTDPAFDGHGGESIAALVARTGAWLHARSEERGRLFAITHPAVVRAAVVAALAPPFLAFWQIDVPPLSTVALTWDGRRWALRLDGGVVDEAT